MKMLSNLTTLIPQFRCTEKYPDEISLDHDSTKPELVNWRVDECHVIVINPDQMISTLIWGDVLIQRLCMLGLTLELLTKNLQPVVHQKIIALFLEGEEVQKWAWTKTLIPQSCTPRRNRIINLIQSYTPQISHKP